MKSTACSPGYVGRRYRERIPLCEMQRLMRVYGSIKCLRRRALGGGADTKADSIKRKFCRWFPDLDARFEKEEGTGRYVPKAGHEAEVRYREEMRAKDGELVLKKRVGKRAEKRIEAVKKEGSSYVKKTMKKSRERSAEEMNKEVRPASGEAAKDATAAQLMKLEKPLELSLAGQAGPMMNLEEQIEFSQVVQTKRPRLSDVLTAHLMEIEESLNRRKLAVADHEIYEDALEEAALAAAARRASERASSRHMKKRNGEKAVKSSDANAKGKAAPFSPTAVSPDNSKLTFSSIDAEEDERKALVSAIQTEIGPGLNTCAAEEEPLEGSFIAKGWKLDDVEESFFRPSPSPGDVAARQDHAPPLKGTGLERLNLLVRILGDG